MNKVQLTRVEKGKVKNKKGIINKISYNSEDDIRTSERRKTYNTFFAFRVYQQGNMTCFLKKKGRIISTAILTKENRSEFVPEKDGALKIILTLK